MLLALVLGPVLGPVRGPVVNGGPAALPGALPAAPDTPQAGLPSAEFEPCTLPRVECFFVADPDGTEVAAVRLLRLDTPGHTLLERDIVFRAEGQRVHHTERLTGALLDRLTHYVSILEMNGDSYRLAQSRARKSPQAE